jgi:hypothetical protein
MNTGAVPEEMGPPSVTYVSLSGSDDVAADDSGHRFLVLQCHGRVRVLQACKGAYGYTVGRLMPRVLRVA